MNNIPLTRARPIVSDCAVGRAGRLLVTIAATALFTSVWAAAGAGEISLPFSEMSPGVFVHIGLHASATPENHGAIANVGFIIGSRCVAVVDSGGSFDEGNALRRAISVRTPLPVCYVINTHVHPDHVYGNAAFAPDKPHFVGHRNLPASMRARQLYYAAFMTRALGPAEAAQSVLVPPDMTVATTALLDLGGRELQLQAWPTSHTDGDITVFDRQSGTLWLGDLLFRERIPVIDGKLSGWLSTMDSLAAIAATWVVPGHGAPSADWPGVLQPQRRYLLAVRDGVRQALKARQALGEATRTVATSEREKWLLFNDFHAQNVTAAFTELEWED
ncbi:MAG: quinoprotein relay system zinc metallohydrolase 2 [Herminiimonas sp.]|nr:quinoprotein relay system zinc metallohydrolase 2 [Herminiimonas sp.]